MNQDKDYRSHTKIVTEHRTTLKNGSLQHFLSAITTLAKCRNGSHAVPTPHARAISLAFFSSFKLSKIDIKSILAPKFEYNLPLERYFINSNIL